jgi:hypothetical protein
VRGTLFLLRGRWPVRGMLFLLRGRWPVRGTLFLLLRGRWPVRGMLFLLRGRPPDQVNHHLRDRSSLERTPQLLVWEGRRGRLVEMKLLRQA